MKFVAASHVIQVAGLLLLIALVLDRDEPPPVNGETSVGTAATSRYMPAGVVTNDLEETQLRRIVREELAIALNAVDRQPVNDVAARLRSAEENRYQRDYVSQQIDYYASVGSIGEQEMQELQREIAELDDAGRKEMLSKLTRAMNARQIKGQL